MSVTLTPLHWFSYLLPMKALLKKTPARYTSQRKGTKPRRVREEEQLYLVKQEEVACSQEPSIQIPASRYHQNGTREKVLGAVYTPPQVAAALTRWAVRTPEDRVLDPACGEGVFLSAARTRLADLGARRPECVGVDIDPGIAAKIGVICSDFFQWVKLAQPVDVVVGNPPFIRSHLFPETSRTMAFGEMVKMGLRPSRLMSTWLPFLALCCRLLKQDGRLAMVIPEELLHVGYAGELRRFLLARFRRVIVCLPARGIFPDVQAAVVLLLCDNERNGKAGLLSMNYRSLEEGNYDGAEQATPWDWNHKWTHLFLVPRDRRLLDDWQSRLNWQPFRNYGRVEVGVVTGDNGFFILNQEAAAQMDADHLLPIVTSSRNLQGITFGAEDFCRVVSENRPAFLLRATESFRDLPANVRSYIESGRRRHVNTRYKCRIREPWYAVPSVWESDALLLRQAGEMPRLIHLAKKCTATDTIHRVCWERPSLGKQHVVSFMNTFTLLAAELTGRSYGGGVLELMPSEANDLPLPEPSDGLISVFEAVDDRVRVRRFHDAVALVDDVVMPRWMTANDRNAAKTMLERLIQRRNSRDHADN